MEKKKILIIDDEENFTRLVQLNLEETGRYEVKTVNKGSFGIAAAKEFKPDLILLDILMPDIEGGEVAFQLKNDKDVKNIPIVFLTAVATKEQVEKSSGFIGGHPFIAKPVDAEELIECIEKNT
ncbi:MAG: response regulator [Candidatus Omnitrophica bacterium]|jgi:CheY-like chemotaxis protein|nr:response regulator [Candidatus Omnitrophota bacterium]MCF7892089.1 response regulator [Candidatus Omnitrophota bacterium]MCF7895920.1 response regulator [Candidatus Omnitrophota bacterium]MCF7908980.1 response regulator [Candidatus Omnitrophota bacterium]